MKKFIPFLFLALLPGFIEAQSNYWQQQVNFTINVSLNDEENTLTAFETIEYINHSPDTLYFIWFHLWPNAYKNDRTAFSEQLLKERRTDFYFSKPSDKGYINQLEFKVDGTNAEISNGSNNIDVIKLMLPHPLAPGNKTVINTPFKVKLPYNFSRGGHVGKDYQVSQWFPKPAVYDKKGWHQMPYLDQGEFYSEFGNFDVEITAPSAYVVASTGVLQDTTTLHQFKENGKHTIEGNTKLWHYKQDNIHDFAWFASKDFIVQYDTAVLSNTKSVEIFSYYKPASKAWKESTGYAKDGIKKLSNWIGDYPYTVCSIVQGSKNENSEGMEYPTIALITSTQNGKSLDATIVHEIGHNWFYGALATNERAHPWMDEGMNTYYQKRYEREKYSFSPVKKMPFSSKLPTSDEESALQTFSHLQKDQPIETSSEQFTTANYALIAYYKASQWMIKLEKELGKELFDKSMQQYYSTWKFKHPYPEDFKSSIEKSADKNLANTFDLLNKTGSFELTQKKPLKPALLFNLNNKNTYINLAPVVGYNYYDKGMIGSMIHNYTLPLPKFQFFAGVLYATGSQKINSFGRASYNLYKRNYHFSTGVSYISYSQNDFVSADKTKFILSLRRWVPSAKFTIFNKDPLTTRRLTLQWKTFLINEGSLLFRTVSMPTGTSDEVSVSNNNSYINRLSIAVSDNKVLFPYSLTLSTDQGKDFIKTGFTAKAFFNYADGKSGMNVRFFVGKFFYLKPATIPVRFRNDRFFLNMTGPNGREDYTYSEYFAGRNEFSGWRSQQIMERDGFFKVNTALLGNKIGKTDDWLMSANFSSDLSGKMNPLSVLPIKVPLKIFADIGTYAEAWQESAPSGRFIYDAGIQIPLFHSLIDVYIPIIYSKVYSNYYKSTITEKRFLKTIAFTINISKLKVEDILKDIPL